VTAQERTRWTLYHRLLLLGMLPALVMFLLMLLFFTQARLDDTRESLFQGTQLIADNLAPAVEFPVIAGNHQELNALLQQTLERSRVKRIEVRDRDGDVVGKAGSISDSIPENLHHFESQILREAVNLRDQGAFSGLGTFGEDFDQNERRIGTVRVTVSEAILAAEPQDILWTSAGIGLILFAGTLIFSGRVAYRFSVPIERLARNVSNLPDGDLEVHSGETLVARELQTLEDAVQSMANRLKSAESEREISFQQLAEARDKAEQASNAKSDFLAMMSHELRTPLHGIIGMLQLLEQESLSVQQQDYLITARQSTEDLLVIINDILDFSRIERGRLELDQVPFDLRSVIENCFASYRHDAEAHHLDYQIRWRGEWHEGLETHGDPGRLRQILAHLIGNAIKFTPEGYVFVTAHWSASEDSEGLLTCEIEDSGAGIPAERLSDMFNTFEQLDGTASRRFGGTGLGLPLVQRLVELMGGHIAVDTDPGCGSRFRFIIPMALHQPETELDDVPARDLGERQLPGESSDYEALVVEDNVVNQRVAARLLETLGFHVRCASNGAAAVDDVQSSNRGYDVVLMDCQMPVMDGWEATRRIRNWERQHNRSQMPIIAMTADVLPDTEKSCFASGMDAYLPKPVRRDSLRDALKRLISL